MNQWQAWSRQYMNAWQDLARSATATPPSPTSPPASSLWPEGFEQWARAFAAASGGQSETADRLIDGAKSYAAFMQSMLTAMTNGQHASATPWSDARRHAAPNLVGGLFEHPTAQAWHAAQEQGRAGLAQLLGAFGGLPATPPNFGEFKSWLHLPAFGVMREHQERQQKLGLAWLEYQEQLGRYGRLMLEASRRGFELFEGKLAEREQPGRQIESLRALYDLWVDAAEEGYAEIALSPIFREVYGALVNAQMRLRSLIQQQVERLSTELGMPTRSEVNSIGERLQALRREVRARSGASAEGALADEVAALREELAALKASVKRASASEHADGSAAPRRRAAPAPRAAATLRKSPRGGGERAVAATASGNFASRIEKFASDSLGAPRKRAQRGDKPAAGTRKTKR